MICRCEEVTEQEIRAAIRTGARTIDAVKRLTRAGMGLCQGRTCSSLVAGLIREEKRVPLEEIPPPRKRLPLRPLEISFLVQQDVEE
ncbi:MAG: (2Fe-2S)-binding protein [Candidatus Heimdallarchaeota archaeon]